MPHRRFSTVKYIAVVLIWFLSLVLWIALSAIHEDSSEILTSPQYREALASQNHIGAFKFMHYNPDQDGRLSSVLSFDSLATENGNLGMFKTSLQRTIRIEGLKVGVYGYDSEESETPLDFDDSAVLTDVVKCGIEKLNRMFCGQQGEQTNFEIKPAVDFNNITRLLVVGFQFNRYKNESLALEVACNMAETVYDQSGFVLKGHVTIKTGDGDMLECNQVIWDIKNQKFNAKNGYAFRQNGITRVGKEIWLDMSLNEVEISQNQFNDRKETQRCYAQLK